MRARRALAERGCARWAFLCVVPRRRDHNAAKPRAEGTNANGACTFVYAKRMPVGAVCGRREQPPRMGWTCQTTRVECVCTTGRTGACEAPLPVALAGTATA